MSNLLRAYWFDRLQKQPICNFVVKLIYYNAGHRILKTF